MPIGKDSIQKRVAKATEAAPVEEVKVEATAETPAPAVKPAAKKASATKSTSAGTKKTTTKKAPAKKPAAKVEAPAVDIAVLANVSPETVAAVLGHDEKKPSDKVKIGQKMPTYLL